MATKKSSGTAATLARTHNESARGSAFLTDDQLAPGFLDLTYQEIRSECLALPLGKLIERIRDRLNTQADWSQDVDNLLEMAIENSPNNSDSDKTDAALRALKRIHSDQDSSIGEMAGYLEALIVRVNSPSLPRS